MNLKKSQVKNSVFDILSNLFINTNNTSRIDQDGFIMLLNIYALIES